MSRSVVATESLPVDGRQRAARRLAWSLVVLFILLTIGIPAGIYFAWIMKGRGQLRKELSAIAAAGEPLTTAEMNAWYKVPAGQPDITPIWTAALSRCTGFNQRFHQLADVSEFELPPLGQTLRDEAGMRQLLTTIQPALAELHAAAEHEGIVRYPHDFSEGLSILLPEIENMGAADRALRLEFFLLARGGDTPGVLRNFRTRMRMADTLASEPLQVALLVRQSYHKRVLRDMHQYVLSQSPFPDGDFQQFLSLVRAIDYQDQLQTVLIGERALCYRACHYRFADEQELFTISAKNAVQTTGDPGAVPRPEDCAATVRLLTEVHNGTKLPPAAFLAIVAKVRGELERLQSDGRIQQWRYQQTLTMLPSILSSLDWQHNAVVYRDLVDVAMNLERYRQQQGELPAEISELCPNFMPALPVDLYDGQPLKTKRTERVLTIYSVGPDRVDNGGESRFPELDPDIAVTIPLVREDY